MDGGEIVQSVGTRLKFVKDEGKPFVLLEGKPAADSYWYFSAAMHFDFSGMHSNLDKYRYLTVLVSADGEAEFHGMLFRKNGYLYKLAVKGGAQSVPLTADAREYTLSLQSVGIGSEYFYEDKSALSGVDRIELYFRGHRSVNVKIHSLFPHDFENGSVFSAVKTETEDSSMILPTAANEGK